MISLFSVALSSESAICHYLQRTSQVQVSAGAYLQRTFEIIVVIRSGYLQRTYEVIVVCGCECWVGVSGGLDQSLIMWSSGQIQILYVVGGSATK